MMARALAMLSSVYKKFSKKYIDLLHTLRQLFNIKYKITS